MATQEEKIEAVTALRNRGKKTVTKVAEKFGVSVPTLYQWQKALAGASTSEPANGHAQGPGPRLPDASEQPALPLVTPLVNGNGKALDMTVFDELASLRAENAELRSLLKKLL